MLIDNNTISNILNKIASNIHPDKVFLFGSYATGKAKEDSDIDL
jgi:predicted nucleotidyltransferase